MTMTKQMTKPMTGIAIAAMLLALAAAARAQSTANGPQSPVSSAPAGQEGKSTAPADADAAPDPLHLTERMIVTGTRTDLEISKAPISTTVVTKQELEIRGRQTLDGSLDLAAGVFSLRTKGPADTNTRINVRGFNGANRTLILLDGQPLNDAYTGEVSWTSLPGEEVDRLEVVRGAFSSLYGGNAMGGVVNILTRPVDRRDVEGTIQYGTHDTQNYSARAAGRLFGRLGLSLGVQRLTTDGYASRAVTTAATTGTTGTRVTGVVPTYTTAGARTYQIGFGGANWYDQNAVRAKGEWLAGSSTLLSGQYLRQSSGYGYNGYSNALRDASTGAVVDRGPVLFDDGGMTRALTFTPGTFISGPGQARSNLVSGSVQHAFGKRGLLKAVGGVYDQPDNSFRTPTAATASLTGGPGSISLRASRSAYGNIQYTAPTRAGHTAIIGVDFRRERSDNEEFTQSDWTNVDDRVAQTYASAGRTATSAFYVQDQVAVGKALTLVAGGRVDHWQTSDGFSNTYTAASPLTTYPDRSTTALTGKLSAAWQPGEAWTVRGSAGTAFRNPTVYDLYRTFRLGSTLYLATPTLEPERLVSVEGGIVRRLGTRLTVDATVYRNVVSEMIYRKTDLAADPTGATRVNVNAGEGTTNGAELSGRVRVAAWLEVRAQYSFTDAIISKNAAVPASEGKRVPYVPRHMSAVSAIAVRGKWSGSLSARHSGVIFNTDTNTDTTKDVPGSYNAAFTTDGSISYQAHRRLQLFVTGDNLFDRQFYLFYLNPGRTLNVGLRMRL
jgi:iron complex outermembrane receptor protein